MTIEERAFEYANNNPHGNPYNWSAHHDAYIDGATEQKAIDIDKAVIWVDENVGSLTAIALRKHLEE